MVHTEYLQGLFTRAHEFGASTHNDNGSIEQDTDAARNRLLAAAYRTSAAKLEQDGASLLYDLANQIDPDFKGSKRRTRDIAERRKAL